MLTRILDTSKIDTNNPEIKFELEIDLNRMDKLDHSKKPKGTNAYQVKVKPSTQTYMDGLHRFIFEIQYGAIRKGKFKPKGELIFYQSETLPMI